jgi:hypothetical protein
VDEVTGLSRLIIVDSRTKKQPVMEIKAGEDQRKYRCRRTPHLMVQDGEMVSASDITTNPSGNQDQGHHGRSAARGGCSGQKARGATVITR